MRILFPLFSLALTTSVASSQVYFPLHIGDSWGYEDHSSVLCEGTSVIALINSDTVLNGRPYFKFLAGPSFAGPFLRADSMRVYEFDTTSNSEYVVFDFSASPGDTVSIRDNGTTITIALGNLKFSVGQAVFTIRDSIGVVSWYVPWNLCFFELTGAWIDGRFVTTSVSTNSPPIPHQLYLEPNYPNPFNPSTTIRLFLPSEQRVSIAIYNSLAQRVQLLYDGKMITGWHTLTWDGRSQPTGVYFCRVQTQQSVLSRRLVLIK
jgi:hypothetical protein